MDLNGKGSGTDVEVTGTWLLSVLAGGRMACSEVEKNPWERR